MAATVADRPALTLAGVLSYEAHVKEAGIAEAELGEPVVIADCLGTDEHFWDTSEIEGVDAKHYLATAYRCRLETDSPTIAGDDQHSAIDVFHPPFDELPPYVERYLEAL
jgi:colanic acid biosynthesis protein WcaH